MHLFLPIEYFLSITYSTIITLNILSELMMRPVVGELGMFPPSMVAIT